MTNNNKKKNIFLALAVAVLLPLSFYAITAVMSSGKLHVPKRYVVDHVEDRADGTKDTIYHRVGDLTLTDQFGNQRSINQDFKGRILVVNLMFTHCPSICPRLTNNLLQLQKAFQKDPKKQNNLDTAIQIISITVDPERDSFPELRKFADAYNVNLGNWSFLTGDRATIYNFARNELFVNMQKGSGGLDDMIHSEKLVLIDTARNIRGYYSGTDTADVIRCADDIVILTKEKRHKK